MIPSWWSHMCTDLRAPLTAFNKLNGSLYSMAICLPLPGRSPTGEGAWACHLCRWARRDQWTGDFGGDFGGPTEQLSPSTAATHVCGFLGSPVSRGSLSQPGQGTRTQHRCLRAVLALVTPHGQAGCAPWHISSQMTFREHKSHSLLQAK